MSKGTGRKYGDKQSRPIYVWNGILEPKHRQRIGPAIWLFLYFIDRTTKERPNQHNPDEIQGWVYGKMPLTLERISRETGIPERTISGHLLRLECHDYVRTVRAPHGVIVLVQKSCKWLKGERQSAKTCVSRHAESGVSGAKRCVSRAKNGECRKDKAVDSTGDKAIGGESTALCAVFPPYSEFDSERQPQEESYPQPYPLRKTKGIWDSPEQRAVAYAALDTELRERRERQAS